MCHVLSFFRLVFTSKSRATVSPWRFSEIEVTKIRGLFFFRHLFIRGVSVKAC
jgi:hypothetical protein